MATAVITDWFREALVDYLAGNRSDLPRITKVGVGSGGHLGTEARDASPTQTGLAQQLAMKTAQTISKQGAVTLKVSCKFTTEELAGAVVSETGLFTEAGKLVALKNYTPKYLEEGETYTFTINLAL